MSFKNMKRDDHGHVISNDETDGQECQHNGGNKPTTEQAEDQKYKKETQAAQEQNAAMSEAFDEDYDEEFSEYDNEMKKAANENFDMSEGDDDFPEEDYKEGDTVKYHGRKRNITHYNEEDKKNGTIGLEFEDGSWTVKLSEIEPVEKKQDLGKPEPNVENIKQNLAYGGMELPDDIYNQLSDNQLNELSNLATELNNAKNAFDKSKMFEDAEKYGNAINKVGEFYKNLNKNSQPMAKPRDPVYAMRDEFYGIDDDELEKIMADLDERDAKEAKIKNNAEKFLKLKNTDKAAAKKFLDSLSNEDISYMMDRINGK